MHSVSSVLHPRKTLQTSHITTSQKGQDGKRDALVFFGFAGAAFASVARGGMAGFECEGRLLELCGTEKS